MEHKTHSGRICQSRSHRPPALLGLTHPVPLLPPPRTHPEGAQPDGRFCRVCDSRWKCLQASWPRAQGLDFNSQRSMGRITPSRSDARDLLRQRTRGTAHAPPHSTPLLSPQVPLNSSWKAPKPQTTPRNSQGTGQPPPPISRTLLAAFSPPRTVASRSRGVRRKPRETASRGASLRPPSH